MVDAEKVKAGLRICSDTKKFALGCNECPYLNEVLCVSSLASDVAELIALLEERIAIMQESMEALEKRLKDPDRINVTHCKDCKHLFDGEQTENCCDVLMEKTGWMHEISVSPDWYCADGETR